VSPERLHATRRAIRTCPAALNFEWPGSKLNIYICCDDAKRTDVPK
jgi:hypothetical protein